ncbi:hypothetical protein SASPL_151326 [Salvia splendens]|uniref:Legume lectin domain-containing protein n=1 Tax=Salvia splendens TaxID=180675 RepID=A0A8X8Z3L7_SALSN|nr:hypothetical protein SASPL_151326 [Salvia splendens]
MAKLLQSLIPLLSLLLLATATTARSQSTSFTYDFYGQKPTDLIYQGDAHFPSDASGNPLSHPACHSNPIYRFLIPTFFIQPESSPLGFTGASFGIFNPAGLNPSVFAVEFDIYPNAGVDPSYRHVGIDIGSNVSKNKTDVGGALLGLEVTARINYVQATKLISVQVSAGSESFEVSYVQDLSSFLPQMVEVGISGNTGGAIEVFDVVAWYLPRLL